MDSKTNSKVDGKVKSGTVGARLVLLLAATWVVLTPCTTVKAYVTHGEWDSNEVVMRASSVSFPVGSAYRTALATITSRYFNNPSEMWFTQQYGDGSVGFDNGQNEVWFSASADYDPAVTFWWYDWWSGDIEEADVVFYNGEAYTTSMNKTSLWSYGGGSRPFQTTAIHEYGHAAGLAHEADEYNIMGSDWTHIHCNGSTARSYVGEDASDGLVSRYGLASGGTFEDVSVSMFEYAGFSGEYSTHGLCDVLTNAGGTVGSTAFNGQRRYNVSLNTTYKFEFTFENDGEAAQTLRGGYYLSNDSNITTGDTLLATTNITLNRNDTFTYQRSLAIPGSLTSGTTYYLGVIIDDNNALAEVDSSNNAAYHIIRVN